MRRNIKLGISALIVLVALGSLMAWLPPYEVKHNGGIAESKYTEYVNNYRATLISALTAFGLVFAAYFSWKNYVGSFIKQSAERYFSASQQLGAVNKEGAPIRELRIAAIYEMEKILRDEPDYYWSVIGVLCAYVRGNSSNSSLADMGRPRLHPYADVQAALDVIGSCSPRSEDTEPTRSESRRLDLSDSNLRGAYLEDLSFKGFYFWRSDLSGADLRKTNLANTQLYECMFGLNLDLPELETPRESLMEGTNLSGAKLLYCDLRGSRDLTLAQLRAADDPEAAFLPQDFLAELELATSHNEDLQKQRQADPSPPVRRNVTDTGDSTEVHT